ncbi:hypothetical protein Gorai_013024 [Gossypium raimondii]|uniref:Reverse transcriptase zinc-binding domain-containing protein n=1 Tax=Gossypium raimondii TaxID=29730 RepID=A0A7J8Q4B8_GOSRA|nr:hypothetical protein [Gossypium raimondii]
MNALQYQGLHWKIGHNVFPTYDNIARIRHNFSTTYPRCKNGDETLIHAMKECPKVREIFMIGGLNNRLLSGRNERCIDWLKDVLRELNTKAAVDFFTLLWNCWNDRNKMVFQGKDDTTLAVWERRQTLSKDFRIFNLANRTVIPQREAIARDHEGFVLGRSYGYANKYLDAVWAEFEALVDDLKLAC